MSYLILKMKTIKVRLITTLRLAKRRRVGVQGTKREVIYVSGASLMTVARVKRSLFISTRKWAAEFDTAGVDSS